MTQYCISEENTKWVDVSAKTLAEAKRMASKSQMFQGTDIFVGIRRDEFSVDVVAKKLNRNKLSMNASGGWVLV